MTDPDASASRPRALGTKRKGRPHLRLTYRFRSAAGRRTSQVMSNAWPSVRHAGWRPASPGVKSSGSAFVTRRTFSVVAGASIALRAKVTASSGVRGSASGQRECLLYDDDVGEDVHFPEHGKKLLMAGDRRLRLSEDEFEECGVAVGWRHRPHAHDDSPLRGRRQGADEWLDVLDEVGHIFG